MNTKTVTIIGAGPAGITAALQLRRAGIEFAIFEKGDIGGLLLNANLVENYPGLEKPISGIELVARFRRQMSDLGIEVTKGKVNGIQRTDDGFEIKIIDEDIKCKYVVIATGTKPKVLDIGDKVEYDVYPLRNVRNKRMAVIGGGDAAFDYALNLAKNDNQVSLYCRSTAPTCLKLLYERAKKHPSVELFIGEEFKDLGYDHVVAAIGREPCTDFISKELMDIKVEGLYFAGDVVRGNLRQLVMAAGDGMFAAQDIIQKENTK